MSSSECTGGAWLVNEGLGYIMGMNGGRGGRGTSYFHVHSAGWTVPVAFALGASLGLGLGPAGSAGPAGSGYGRSTDWTVLFILLAFPSLSPRLPRMESSLGACQACRRANPHSYFPRQRQQRSRFLTRHRSARGPSPELPRPLALLCLLL